MWQTVHAYTKNRAWKITQKTASVSTISTRTTKDIMPNQFYYIPDWNSCINVKVDCFKRQQPVTKWIPKNTLIVVGKHTILFLMHTLRPWQISVGASTLKFSEKMSFYPCKKWRYIFNPRNQIGLRSSEQTKVYHYPNELIIIIEFYQSLLTQ